MRKQTERGSLWGVYLIFWFALGAGPALADGTQYPNLPAAGCPGQGLFFLNHFLKVGALAGCAGSVPEIPVYRGGKPNELGADCLDALGVTLVIDLRSEGETNSSSSKSERAWLEARGIRYLELPMTTSPSVPSKKCKDAKLTAVECTRQNSLDAVAAIRQRLGSHRVGAIYVHCARGEDRTGLVFGLLRHLEQDCSVTSARKEMSAYGYSPYPQLNEVWQDLTSRSGTVRNED